MYFDSKELFKTNSTEMRGILIITRNYESV